MTGFGECEGCGNGVERVGWDRLCFSCQAEHLDLIQDNREQEEGWHDWDIWARPSQGEPAKPLPGEETS